MTNNQGFKKVNNSVNKPKSKSIYVNKVACPECNSLETKATNPAILVSLLGMSISGWSLVCFSMSLWIPILGWMMLIPFGVGIILGFIISIIGSLFIPFTKNLNFNCSSCGSVHKISIKEYKELARNK